MLFSSVTIYKIFRDAYANLVENLGEKIDQTKRDVSNMVHHIATNFSGEIPGVVSKGIPLNPTQDDFKYVRFWKQGVWKPIRNGELLCLGLSTEQSGD